MAQSLQSEASVLSIGYGRRERQAQAARLTEPTSGVAPADGKGNLYVLVEVEGSKENRERLYRDLHSFIQETYYSHTGSMTAALTAALQRSHSFFQAFGKEYGGSYTGGITALAVNGTEIILAQAGPTILAVRNKAGLQWFSPLNKEHYAALGGSEAPQVEVGRLPGQPNTVLVMMNSAWANYLEVALMQEATAIPRAYAIADQLAGIAIDAPQELNLVVITLMPLTTQPRTQPTPPPVAARPATPSPTPPVVETAEDDDMWEEVGPDDVEEDEEEVDEQAGVGAKVAGVGRSVGGFFRQIVPERETPTATARTQRKPARRIPYALAIAGALLLAIVLIAAGMWVVQSRQRSEAFNEYMQGAQITLDAAASTEDENVARQNLQAAEEQINQAAAFFPDHPDVEVMRNRIAELKARVNHVIPVLKGFDTPLTTFGAGAQPSEVFVNGLNLYVLDRGRSVLERYQLDPDSGDRLAADTPPQVLLQKGQDVDGRVVGDLAHAVWAPASGNRTATGPLVLDQSNQLFGVVEGLGPQNVALSENSGLGFVSDMEYYSGNLYLLDSNNSQLWRYRPSGESYVEAPEGYFTPEAGANLSTVSDVAIDGNIWLLHPNGTVLKYFAGAQESVNMDIVDPPFSDARLLWANEADIPGGRLYIADTASNRILVFDKDGKLLTQLMPVDHPGILNNLRSMYVDEVSNYIYLLTDSALYQIPLPPSGSTA